MAASAGQTSGRATQAADSQRDRLRCTVASVFLLVSGCHCNEAAPTPLAPRAGSTPAVEREPRRGPFADPARQAPAPRSASQLPAAELEAVIERGVAFAHRGDNARALTTLDACANRVPISVRCEGELALAVSGIDAYQAYAHYYLSQASNTDDPGVPSELYRRLGRAGLNTARFADAAAAFRIVTARGDATGRDHADLARALQADPQRRPEAAQALASAIALDPSQPEWLRTQAILRAQMGENEAAFELFAEYQKAVGKDTPQARAVAPRMASLRQGSRP